MISSKKSLSEFYKTLAAIFIILIAAGYISMLLKEIMSPLFFAFLFSVLLFPLASFMERRLKLARSGASILSVIFLLATIALILYVVASQISRLTGDWPLFKEQVNSAIYDLQHWISEKFNVDIRKQSNYVNETMSRVLSSSTSVLGATVVSVSSLFLFLAFTMINTFFLLFYRRLIVKFLIALFTEENSLIVYDVISNVQYVIRRYIVGLLLEMLIVSGVACTALSILGVRYAILLGLITGLFNIIPYIGIFTAIALSALITFATAGSASKVLAVALTLFAIHLTDSNVLLPIVVGSKVRINAFVTLLGVIIGEIIWGISGMFLAIPFIAIAKIIFDRIEPLKPWGMLFGDEKDEKRPGKLSKEVKKGRI